MSKTYTQNIYIDSDGEYIVEIPEELMKELRWNIGDTLTWCTDLYWNSIIQDYETRVSVRKKDE
jgi:hypothetical protein